MLMFAPHIHHTHQTHHTHTHTYTQLQSCIPLNATNVTYPANRGYLSTILTIYVSTTRYAYVQSDLQTWITLSKIYLFDLIFLILISHLSICLYSKILIILVHLTTTTTTTTTIMMYVCWMSVASIMYVCTPLCRHPCACMHAQARVAAIVLYSVNTYCCCCWIYQASPVRLRYLCKYTFSYAIKYKNLTTNSHVYPISVSLSVCECVYVHVV